MSELLGLNVADVDFAHATAIVLGKGNKQRVVPIGKTALSLLESYLEAVRPFLVGAGAWCFISVLSLGLIRVFYW